MCGLWDDYLPLKSVVMVYAVRCILTVALSEGYRQHFFIDTKYLSYILSKTEDSFVRYKKYASIFRVPDLRGNQDVTNLNWQVKLVAGKRVSVSLS